MGKLLAYLMLFRLRLNPGGRTFKRISELLSLLPGNFGLRTRRVFYAKALSEGGGEVEFAFGMILNYRDIRMGKNVSFGRYCSVGLVDFEDDVLVSGYCHFLSGAHIHDFSNPDQSIRQQSVNRERITIGRGAWIGAGAIVMADVGEGAIVGAGSTITKPVAPYHVVAGNPARVLRVRQLPKTGNV